MSERRVAKVSEAIREIVSTAVLFEVNDPRVKNVTVLRAEVSADIRHARVYVSVRGDEKLQRNALQGLQSARGFIQSKLGDRLQTRYTPVLTFYLDRGLEMSAQTSAILREVLGDQADTATPPTDEAVDSPEVTGSTDDSDEAPAGTADH